MQGGRFLPMLTELLAALQVSPCSEELSLPQRHREGPGIRLPSSALQGGRVGRKGEGQGQGRGGPFWRCFSITRDGRSPEAPMALLLPKSPRRPAGHVGSPGRKRGRINRIDLGLYFILAVALIGRFSCGVSEVWVATPLGTEFVGHELRLRISAPPSWESPKGKLAMLHSKKHTGRQDLLCAAGPTVCGALALGEPCPQHSRKHT